MKRSFTAILMCGLLGASLLQTAATPQLEISDGVTTTIVVTDEGPMDSNPTVGAITYIGPVGPNWSLNVTTGLTKPAAGSAAAPELDVSTSSTSQAAGNLLIELTDSDFVSSGSAQADIGGTTVGTVSYRTFVDPNNVNFAETTMITSQGPFGP